MRFLPFEKPWPKLYKPIDETFTTFRFPWKDGFEHQIGDKVQPVLNNRSPRLIRLGIAIIVGKDTVDCSHNAHLQKGSNLSDEEAQEDGFISKREMCYWLQKHYRQRSEIEPLIKYTLKWLRRMGD